MVYICTNFLENILDSIEVIERTQFSYEKFQRGGGGGGGGGGGNSLKYISGFTVLILCTSSDSGSYLYTVS